MNGATYFKWVSYKQCKYCHLCTVYDSCCIAFESAYQYYYYFTFSLCIIPVVGTPVVGISIKLLALLIDSLTHSKQEILASGSFIVLGNY